VSSFFAPPKMSILGLGLGTCTITTARWGASTDGAGTRWLGERHGYAKPSRRRTKDGTTAPHAHPSCCCSSVRRPSRTRAFAALLGPLARIATRTTHSWTSGKVLPPSCTLSLPFADLCTFSTSSTPFPTFYALLPAPPSPAVAGRRPPSRAVARRRRRTAPKRTMRGRMAAEH